MATKQRHQTWGPPPTEAEQFASALGLDSGRNAKTSAFRGRRAEQQVDPDALAAAVARRLAGEPEAPPRHARWGDKPPARPDRLPMPVERDDDGLVSEEELARLVRIRGGRAARLLPWQAGAATAAAGTVAWGAALLGELGSGLGGRLFVAACAGLLVLLGLVRWRWMTRDLFRPGARLARWRHRARLAAGGAVAWVVAWAAAGPSWPLAAAGILFTAAVSAEWLRVHAVTVPSADTVDEAPNEPEAAAFARRWADRVACPGGLVPRSLLDDGRDVGDGMRFRLVLPSGWTVTAVQNRLEQVASALRCDRRQLVVEHVDPDESGWVAAHEGKLTFLHSSPIIGVDEVEHTGPRYSRPGRIGIGPYIDGSGEAEFVLADGESVWSGFVCGATGAGKSELVTALVADGRATLPIVTVYWDGKRGSSSPDLAAAATVKAFGPEDAERFTACVEALVRGLGDRAARTGESSFQWGPDRPIYWVVKDEADMLYRLPGMSARWAVIGKTLRALGGGLLDMSQEGDLSVFGNNGLLRSSVCRNVVLMHIPTGDSGSLVGGGVLPPASSIPMGGGYAHLKAEDSRSRELMRGRRLRSSRACVKEGLDPDTAWGARRALREAPDAPLCEVGRAAFAPLLDPSSVASGPVDEPTGAPAETPVDAPSDAEKARARAAWGQGPTDEAAESPPDRQETAESARPKVQTPDAALPDGLTSNQAAVLRALRAVAPAAAEPASTRQVADEAGLRVDSTGRALKALVVKGEAVDAGRAGWTAATASGAAVGTASDRLGDRLRRRSDRRADRLAAVPRAGVPASRHARVRARAGDQTPPSATMSTTHARDEGEPGCVGT